MSSATGRKPRRVFQIQKPNGQLSSRVQAVGPERFGIVAVDVNRRVLRRPDSRISPAAGSDFAVASQAVHVAEKIASIKRLTPAEMGQPVSAHGKPSKPLRKREAVSGHQT